MSVEPHDYFRPAIEHLVDARKRVTDELKHQKELLETVKRERAEAICDLQCHKDLLEKATLDLKRAVFLSRRSRRWLWFAVVAGVISTTIAALV